MRTVEETETTGVRNNLDSNPFTILKTETGEIIEQDEQMTEGEEDKDNLNEDHPPWNSNLFTPENQDSQRGMIWVEAKDLS